MQRPPQIDNLASQLNNIISELTDEDVRVGVGKTFDMKTKERFFTLLVYSKTRKTARLLKKEIGDIYEKAPVRYRPIGKIIPA